MSHFMVMVLLPETIKPIMINNEIENLLAPYSENIEVDEYEHKCHCVGWKAHIDSTKIAEKKFGEIDKLRDDFRDILKEKGIPFDDFDTRDKLWKEFAKIDERSAYIEEIEKDHEMYNKPDKACTECNGTGIYMSTYNPQSKWDWYQVGGRWTGAFDKNYKPEEDERNKEICMLCEGTGYRQDKIAEEIRLTDPNFKCNGCKNGIAIKWPSQWANYDGDIKPVREITDPSAYAIVTPDGKWYERGEMGWFGISNNEKDKLSWEAEIIAILAEHQDCIAVCVDCHI